MGRDLNLAWAEARSGAFLFVAGVGWWMYDGLRRCQGKTFPFGQSVRRSMGGSFRPLVQWPEIIQRASSPGEKFRAVLAWERSDVRK
jgi:hypothetical protein